jgi:hypothetical protein
MHVPAWTMPRVPAREPASGLRSCQNCLLFPGPFLLVALEGSLLALSSRGSGNAHMIRPRNLSPFPGCVEVCEEMRFCQGWISSGR